MRIKSLENRIIALILSVIMLVGMLPTSVFAANASALTTDIGTKEFVVGQTTGFTFTTIANDDAGTNVLGTFEFSDPSAVEKLEYLEVQSGQWFEFYGDFGPVGTGFPMTDATSQFRVTFNKAGNYTVTASMVTAEGRNVLCSVTENITVSRANPSVLDTNIGDVPFIVGKTSEFTFTTTANEDNGTYVLGTFVFSDPTAVEKLEYLEAQSDQWFEFYGDFGPAGTGFPMTDATSRFRVTFNKVGTYTVTASMVTADNRTVLCSTTREVTVSRNASTLTTNIGEKNFVVGKTSEFTFTTTANEDLGTYVLGTFEFSDPTAVEKLEYLEAQSDQWFQFYGDFGPAGTGFPMADATSRFRVTFNKAGSYTVKASMVTAADRTVLCSATETVTVADTSKLTTDIASKTFVAGQVTEFTYTTEANGDKDTRVLGSFVFSDPSAIEKLEYLEVQSGQWFEFYGDFGPAGTGFPMADATSRFRVTFNKAGTYTVDAAMKAVETGNVLCAVQSTIEVAAAEQTGFHFNSDNPADQWIGDPYQNIAVGGQTDEAIVYEIVEGPATIDAATGIVTFTGLGAVTVKATRPGNEFYKEVSATYVVTSVKNPWEPFGFEISNPTITYAPELKYPNADAQNNLKGKDDSVKFAIVAGDDVATIDPATGELTILKAGVVTVRATRDADALYEAASHEYTLTVEKANQELGFEAVDESTTLTYQPTAMDLPVITGKKSIMDAVYTITVGDGEVAKIEADKLQLLKAGYFEMTVVVPGDDKYNEAELTWKVTVNKADQTNFAFAVESDTITYNDVDKNATPGVANAYTMVTSGGQSTGAVVYEVTDGDAAEFNESGVLTILKSGTVTVTATKAGDDRYNATKATFDLTIEKAEQNFTFGHDKQIEDEYGLTSFATLITASALNSGKVTYAISGDNIGATVDNAGLVSFANSSNKVGTITVTVNMVEDDCYKPFPDTYTITLGYEATPAVPYTLTGDQIITGSQWFTGNVSIVAPAGYKVSYNNDLDNADWADAVVWTVDGEAGTWEKGAEPVVYLKNETTGGITDAISVDDLKKDTVKPTALAIDYDVSVLATIGEKIFGFSAATVDVTVSAEDFLSGIGKMEYSLDEGTTYTKITADSEGKYMFSVPSQYRGQLWIRATDVAGNAEIYQHVENNTDKVLIVDHTEPGLTVTYTGGMDDLATSGIRYVKSGKVIVTFQITDENFDRREADPIVTVNEDPVTGWVYDATSGKLTFELVEDDDYVIRAEFTDRLERKVTYEAEVRLDTVAPKIASTIEDGKYYTEDQTFVLTVTEHNFNAAEVELEISAVDSKNNPVLNTDEIQAFVNMAKAPENWKHTENTDIYTLELPISRDGNYTVKVDCTDNLDWAADTYNRTFTLDKDKPFEPTLKYEVGTAKGELLIETIVGKIFGFAKETTVVTVHSGDVTSGIDRLEYKLHDSDEVTVVAMDEEGNYSFNLDPQYRGKITVVVYDKAGHSSTTIEEKEVVVDNITPKVEITFDGNRQDAVKVDTEDAITRETMAAFDADTRFIYDGNVTATIQVKEANFFPENDDMTVKISHDGVIVTDLAAAGITDSGWKFANDVYTRTFVMSKDGDYQLFAEYKDHSLNEMEWVSKEYAKNGKHSYTSNIHTIDTTAPVYEVTYNNNERIQTRDGIEYYDNSRTATIRVTDRNFRPNEVVFNMTYTDVAGAAVENTYSKLTAWKDWTNVGDTWIAVVPFNPDANYTVDFSYDDLANHKMVNKDGKEETYNVKFTVDTQIPTGLNVAYKSKDDQVVNKVLNMITFGNYKAAQGVVLTMSDATSGMDYIELTVTPEGPASATNLVMPEKLVVNADGSVKSGSKGFIGKITSTANKGDLELSFDVPAQFRGKVSFVAYDKSGNYSGTYDDPGALVVDTIAPGYTISYNPSNIVNVSDMKDMTGYDATNGVTDITSKDASYVMYFSGNAVAKIEIAEANFDPAEVTLVVQDAKGNAVQGWTQTDWVTTTAEGKADVHTKTVTISAEGDYQIKVYYQDHSMNTPVDYLSQWIVVDKTAPVVAVNYANTNVKNLIADRKYLDAVQTATITVKEHNFRADDVVIKVSAKDVLGADVLTLNNDGSVKIYADQGADRNSWTAYQEGSWRVQDDTYVITLKYTTDANYSFDVEYQDLAKNKAADYQQDLFTVDTTMPKNLTVSYSTNVFEQIKESITFGYYNAMMTVTITAEDDTSGIYHFAYSYIKGKDVSGVNAELLDQAIKEAEITYEGKKATATFNIPKMVLGNDNQFNGTVEFVAFDRSENSNELKDTTRVIVDNISPTSNVTYTSPVKTENNISYYAGNIEATVVINEANFDAADVVVSVTRDGTSYPVNVAWRDDNVDTHTGSFVLTEDGDYIVSIQYKDKSGNRMAAYTSNELTLDTTAPTIKVSNIKNNSANKDEKYGFVIEFSDINLDVASMKPVLKAVKQNASGSYEVVEVDLGKATAVVDGQTYTYTVENLPDDGLYTLICEAKDMSNNGMSQITLDDGRDYSQVQFSINRNGSTFGYGSQYTENLVGQYYIYSVDEDVVIVEVNTDPIEEYTVTLNGEELEEGKDFTTVQTSNPGEWSKRVYTIKKALFAEEGEYSIIVSSTDKANTTAYSDIKNVSVEFVVDQTKPVLTITGMETGGRYQTDEQIVTLIPTDEGGRLNSLTVIVLNADGNPLTDENGNNISVRFDMSGEELLKYLAENDGKIVFTIPSGLNNQVQIICNDCALTADNLTNEYSELFEKITVSQNQLVIFYANKPLFFGTIAGAAALIALIVILIKRKQNKKAKI